MSTGRILLLILAFLTLTVGSFIWYVATWDADAEPALGFILDENLPPEASGLAGNTWFGPLSGVTA